MTNGAADVSHLVASSPILEYNDKDFTMNCKSGMTGKFDENLEHLWNKAMDLGYFRYKLNVLTKVLPGKFKFVAQLNVNRAVNRRQPQYIDDIKKPFNHDQFNFTRISDKEVLFQVHPLHWKPRTDQEKQVNLVIINVSPLEQCNSLLIPDILACSPQILSLNSIQLALETMLLSKNINLRIGFNSLGAFASVNHLHFHLYHLKERLYLEILPLQQLVGSCFEILNFPAEGFGFQLLNVPEVATVAKHVAFLCDLLIREKIAHNLFITRGIPFLQAAHNTQSETSHSYNAIRIFVWAREFYQGSKNDKSFNPALCELAGHLPIYSEDFYADVKEEQVESILRETCHDTFLKVRTLLTSVFSKEMQ